MKKTGWSYDHKFVRSDNPAKNIWNKIEKSGKARQEDTSLISTFACFLTPTAKVEFLQARLGTGLGFHPNLRFS